MNVILFDSNVRNTLLPLTFTRPVADIRVGILTIREKWELFLGATTTTLTEDYLSDKYPMVEFQANIMINASFIPTTSLAEKVKNLKENEALFKEDVIVAFYTSNTQEEVDFKNYICTEINENLIQIKNVWDIFKLNKVAIALDFEMITKGRISQPIPDTVHSINKENIFLEEGAKVEIAVLNASKGPIYLGKNAEIMEGCMVRGPFSLGENSVLKMGSKIYGATTLGPHCKVGGEVNNSVFFGYSNKAHDGFLGNSVIGEWCNLGADTNNSNLKNNYANVKLWDYDTDHFKDTGLQFCGLIMGDHSKCGINTMFNTGTVVGVSANIYGGNFPRNFIPSFSWGGSAGFTKYKLPKVFEVASKVMQRRDIVFNTEEKNILQHIYDQTSKYRNY
jgi:UDP-N-acetylglucosamine diphosphorylase/glucosamine-1-phosphate N-acetyltransferase